MHTFTVSATDYIGNAGSQSVTFEIIVTPGSIKDDVRRFVASGDITIDEGRSLLKLLDAAAVTYARGDCKTAGKIYASFINEVESQRNKKIAPTVADFLIADAQYLIGHCP